jgi:hypothetical protein
MAHASSGSPDLCRNCEAKLLGPWCHACGQHSAIYHRAAHHLLFEFAEDIFHADSRIWHTLAGLALRPARLTQNYLAGKRAPQIPPLRLFVAMLVVLFFAGSLAMGTPHLNFNVSQRGKAAVAQTEKALADAAKTADPEDKAELAKLRAALVPTAPSGDASHAGHSRALDWALASPAAPGDAPRWSGQWFKDRITKALENPSEFLAVLGEKSERFAFMTLPISALMLAAIFIFRRQFLFYDHLVFSMHSLSFQGFLIAAMMGLSKVASGAVGWVMLAMPVHLFFHMRGVYGLRIFGTLWRMALLATGTAVAFTALAVAWLISGLGDLPS